jgi:hypothetical protein
MTIKLVIVVLAVVVLLCIAIIYHDMNNFVVRHYEIHSDKISKDTVFVLLSDLHEKSYGKNNERLIAAIDKIDPDIVLLSGDMVTAQNNLHDLNPEPALSILREISKRYPIYAANGNHEYKMFLLDGKYREIYESYEKQLLDLGVVLLRNTGTFVEDLNMEIHGLEMGYEYYKKVFKTPMSDDYIKGYFGEPCESRFQLLIAHNPIYFEEYCKWGADLVVSGHVHGGIARLPFLGGVMSPAVELFPKYDGGLFKEDNRYMVLSRGLGMHTVPVRFNNPGELCVIRVISDKK